MRHLLRNATLALLTLAAFSCAPVHAQSSLPIAAAANLTKVFESQIIPDFAKKTGIKILPTFGATGLLARQLESGAPYGVFVSADVATVQKLASEKDIDPKTIKTYVIGQLALWSKSLPVAKQGLGVLTTSQVSNIAVANPKTAPYGAATIQTLTSLNILGTLNSKIVYAENIDQSLQYAESGNADVSFTALSLVKNVPGGSYYIVPEKLHAPIAQAVGLPPNASPAARRFEQYLLSKDAQKIFAAAGYLSPGK